MDLRKTGNFNGRDWVGTPLADLRGYLNIIERTVDELTVAGGSVSLKSGGSIVIQRAASIDTSAGWLNYGSGTVKTTRLLRNGRLVDIANATPDLLYDSIYTGEFDELHPKWNITRTFRVPWMTGEHFEEGYLSGANAGNQSLAAASMAVDGHLRAAAISGPRQTTTPASGGTLDLSFEIQKLVPGGPVDPLISPTPPNIVFLGDNDQGAAAPFATDAAGDPLPLRADRVSKVVLTPRLFTKGGFAALRVRNPDGNITVPRSITLETPVKGAITLEGANVSVYGNLRAPGGALSFLAYNISPSVAEELSLTPGAQLPPPNPGRGLFTLGAGRKPRCRRANHRLPPRRENPVRCSSRQRRRPRQHQRLLRHPLPRQRGRCLRRRHRRGPRRLYLRQSRLDRNPQRPRPLDPRCRPGPPQTRRHPQRVLGRHRRRRLARRSKPNSSRSAARRSTRSRSKSTRGSLTRAGSAASRSPASACRMTNPASSSRRSTSPAIPASNHRPSAGSSSPTHAQTVTSNSARSSDPKASAPRSTSPSRGSAHATPSPMPSFREAMSSTAPAPSSAPTPSVVSPSAAKLLHC